MKYLEVQAPLENQPYKDWPQILSIIAATLPALSYGILFSWPSPSIPILINDKENYDISLEEASYFSVIPPIAAILTSPLFGWLGDAVGRKPTILSMVIPHFASWMLIAFTNSIWVFYLSRFFTGIADACLFAAVPIYISEISTPKVRGTWGNGMTFGIYLGKLVVNVVGGNTSLQNTAFICAAIPVLSAITFVFVPESPYYYLMKGKIQDARVSLKKLRRVDNVEEELARLQADVKRQISESGTWKDLFCISTNRKALYAGVFLRLSQQLSGAAAFFVYTKFFFEKAGGGISSNISSAIFYTTLVSMNVVAACVLDKLGRRLAMMISLLICSLALYTEMAYFYISDNVDTIDISYLNWIPLAALVTYIAAFQLGIGLVPTLMLGELFSQSVKGKGLCFLNVVFNVCVCSMTKLFQVMQSDFGLFAPFAFFATCSLVNTFLAYYFVPETKGKTLEEIQQNLKNTSKSNRTENKS